MVGGVGSDPVYADEFRRLASSSNFVHWDGPRPHAEVLNIFGSHRVVLNLSWAEVQSLVDLEASLCGCAVVATPAGHSAEWLPESVEVLDSFDVTEGLLTAKARTTGPRPRANYAATWESTVAVIDMAYQDAVARKGRSEA
ncbi:hypothetical protein GCM10023350_25810 [Nocardioides endophyticus]|uniref:Glycosyltransferase family 1 protein n=1 Tax=Nocardioides endophyticus TaxID=1353775 RepID=A0ABP8YXY9_9ACTN